MVVCGFGSELGLFVMSEKVDLGRRHSVLGLDGWVRAQAGVWGARAPRLSRSVADLLTASDPRPGPGARRRGSSFPSPDAALPITQEFGGAR